LEVHRFRIKRRRIAALALLPLAVITASNGIALAAAVTGAPLAGTAPTATAASASGVELKLGKRNVLAVHKVKIQGSVAPGGVRPVEIDVNGKRVKEIKTGPDGRFDTKWRPESPGVYKVQAIVKAAGTQPVSSHARRLNAYRAVEASYYGPGLYGNGVACGGVLTPSKLGVANKTLPCGSKVTLHHGSKTVTVPVIDRGPYSGNRVYDLTTATKNKLGYVGIGPIWATK
jgi:rare lipoprotein A (peptidoglycan hydrolase)